jgi:hypothetical protein
MRTHCEAVERRCWQEIAWEMEQDDYPSHENVVMRGCEIGCTQHPRDLFCPNCKSLSISRLISLGLYAILFRHIGSVIVHGCIDRM